MSLKTSQSVSKSSLNTIAILLFTKTILVILLHQEVDADGSHKIGKQNSSTYILNKMNVLTVFLINENKSNTSIIFITYLVSMATKDYRFLGKTFPSSTDIKLLTRIIL